MTIEKVFISLFLLVSTFSFSQSKDTIRGKLFFSDLFYKNFDKIIVEETSSKQSIHLDGEGKFVLIPIKEKEEYNLIFTCIGDTIRKFKFKKKWTKRKRPKSISLNDSCNFSYKNALKDYKEGRMKLYIFNRNQLHQGLKTKDKRQEKKYNFDYMYLDSVNQFDCYYDYNQAILKILRLKHGHQILNKINKNVIGL